MTYDQKEYELWLLKKEKERRDRRNQTTARV